MQEWYLIGTPSLSSGFENDAFNDYHSDATAEILDSSAGSDVVLYNHDMSERKQLRCLVQGDDADTAESSVTRTAVFPIGTMKAGMYMFYDGCYWLISSFPSHNKFYEVAQMKMCQYCLRWQNHRGDIVERWIHLESNGGGNGQSVGSVMTMLNYDYTFLITSDNETIGLDGKRVFIDPRKHDPYKVFELTRNDDANYQYGKYGGVLQLCAKRTELNTYTDNQKLKICDFKPPHCDDEPSEDKVHAAIAGNSNLIYGLKQTYTVNFCTKNGDSASIPSFQWNVISDIGDHIRYNMYDTNLLMFATDREALGGKCTIQVLLDGEVAAELVVTVVDII